MIGTNSYNNPFVNRDANTDSINEIVNYWCEPIHIELSEMLYSDKAILIEGPRGCGKTTLFKYYSYKGQMIQGQTFINNINEGKYFCIYHRLGEYNYSALDGKGLDETFWENLFVHIFELKLSIMLINMIQEFVKKEERINTYLQDIIRNVSTNRGFFGVKSQEELVRKIEEYIGSVNDFIRKRSMMEVEFELDHWFTYYEITNIIVKAINKNLEWNKRFKVAFIIDEMENLSPTHQRVINTYMKFVKENISFRVGSRPAGISTYQTLTKEDIRENHDYNYIEINPYIHTTDYEKFLIEIANKRLANSIYSEVKNIKIELLLGRKENISEEISRKIPNDFNKHFEILKKKIPNNRLESIRSDDKLQELLNIIKINRGENIEQVANQMKAFNDKKRETDEYKKYVNAYRNKYKKSLAFLLLHIANKKKSYYSLKTFAHLSSGSTRVFLQLCHKVFELTSFYSPESLYKNEMINPDLQTQAALKVAESELNYLKRVGPFGREIFNFIDNICRLFRYYHNDNGLKYPETNQFTLDDTMEQIDKKIIDVARMHAFIIRKRNLQQSSIGQPRTHIYTINRIYYPLYNISCVTRGGFNPRITKESMKIFIESQISNSNLIAKVLKKETEIDTKYEQLGIEGLL